MASVIEVSGICKAFPGVNALQNVSFSVESGLTTALVGENGAGKSTLLSILNGDQKADSGMILMNGARLDLSSPRDSLAAGIKIVRQEPSLVPGLTVAENVLLGQLPKRLGLVRVSDMKDQCMKITERLGIDLDLSLLCRHLGVAQRQMVEIVKALANDLVVLGLDEPTSALSDREVSQLFRVIEMLKRDGVAIIYVSHRMDEVISLADNVVVLRDGKLTGRLPKEHIEEPEIIRLMIGRELKDVFQRVESTIGEVTFELKNYTTDQVGPISMHLRSGEIVGVAGLVGSGRSRLIRAISGVDPGISGEIHVHGLPVSLRTPIDSLGCGIAVCPEDRKKLALLPLRSMSENINFGLEHKGFKGFFIRRREEISRTLEYVKRLGIRPPNPLQKLDTMSGGNAQKVVLSRSLCRQPSILILDEPTRGIDVGAKSDIYDLVRKLTGQGVAVLVVSSELIEVLGLADRIYVMRNGSLAGELNSNVASEEAIMRLALGSEVNNQGGKQRELS